MKFTKTILKNGLRVITVPMKDNPTVTVLVMVEAGSKYETKEINGLSHFLEHMCFKGTTKRPKAIDISRELDTVGAQYNAFTSQEYTGYYAKADYKHLDLLLDVVSDMYLNPVFNENEIEKEKGVIVEEINMYEDLPHRKVQEIFMRLLYGDQPAGWDIAGTKENIKNLKRSDFLDYRRKHYVPSATTVVVAGKFDEKKTLGDIQKMWNGVFGGKKKGKVKTVESQKKPEMLLQYKDTDQTHIVLGARSFNAYSKNNPAIKVLSAALSGGMSSRLFQKLRDEMGICYYVRAENDTYTDHGFLQVSAGLDNKRVKEGIGAIMEEFKKLKTENVSADELNKVKQQIQGNLYLGLETSDSFAEYCGYQEVLNKPIKTPEQIIAEIQAVTADDIKRNADKIFQNKNLNLAAIGRFKDKDDFLPILKF
ncbi:MAG: insulinase family protein [Patescibacteria group bacterium]|nr:insulinase family protein [Patescibacteria group bacterium]MDE2218110.1 insulinase family protein [Patescibacteria group bacterium]